MKIIKEYSVDTLSELTKVAKDIVDIIHAQKYNIVKFYGHMGAGKTTLIRHICEALEIDDDVTSPTFAIINEYRVADSDELCYHFDFYRINKIEEVMDMGYEEYFYSGNLCLIEWPEMIDELLPRDDEEGVNNLVIEIEAISQTERKIVLKQN